MAKFCTGCGNQLGEFDKVCVNCGKSVDGSDNNFQQAAPQQDPNMNMNQGYAQPQQMAGGVEQKSKMVAGLLGIFLGGLGVHNFYLGNTGKAVAQLLLTLVGWVLCVGPLVAEVWGLVEGIMILTGSINTDANGVPLKD